MRFFSFMFCLFLAATLAPCCPAAIVFNANLNGSQANAGAGTGSAATGTAMLVLNDAQTRLDISITINGIDFVDQGGTDTAANNATVFHIHAAPAGVNGGVVFGFIGPNNDADGDLVITPFLGGATIVSGWNAAEGNGTTLSAQLTNLLTDRLYINLHTTGFASGEIRGQISQVPEPSSLCCLTGLAIPILFRRKRHRLA